MKKIILVLIGLSLGISTAYAIPNHERPEFKKLGPQTDQIPTQPVDATKTTKDGK